MLGPATEEVRPPTKTHAMAAAMPKLLSSFALTTHLSSKERLVLPAVGVTYFVTAQLTQCVCNAKCAVAHVFWTKSQQQQPRLCNGVAITQDDHELHDVRQLKQLPYCGEASYSPHREH